MNESDQQTIPSDIIDCCRPPQPAFSCNRYFKSTRYSTFKRQLSWYQFTTILKGEDKGAVYSEFFLRGRPDLAATLRRGGDSIDKFLSSSQKAFLKKQSQTDPPNFYLDLPHCRPLEHNELLQLLCAGNGFGNNTHVATDRPTTFSCKPALGKAPSACEHEFLPTMIDDSRNNPALRANGAQGVALQPPRPLRVEFPSLLSADQPNSHQRQQEVMTECPRGIVPENDKINDFLEPIPILPSAPRESIILDSRPIGGQASANDTISRIESYPHHQVRENHVETEAACWGNEGDVDDISLGSIRIFPFDGVSLLAVGQLDVQTGSVSIPQQLSFLAGQHCIP